MNPVKSIRIQKISAREVLDSRGFPTVEAELVVGAETRTFTTRAIVPSGASTGEGEALELRDSEPTRYLGKGVRKAVSNITDQIAPAVLNRDFARQTLFDDVLRDLDGTPNKSKLGANAILACSMAFARAQAEASGLALFESIAHTYGTKGYTLPVPMLNIINGGAHADNSLEIQEFMIMPVGFDRFSEALRAGSEIFHALKKFLKSKNLSTGVGDEGGFAPDFGSAQPHDEALGAIVQAIGSAGYKAGKEVFLALDVAASELVDRNESSAEKIVYRIEGRHLTSGELVERYQSWLENFPIVSIEDGLSEHDWAGWQNFTARLSDRCQIVGDDLFVTNPAFLKKGIEQKTANSILIKLNQIGTVTETLETIKLASQSGYTAVTSHRSGESEDTFIADLAVGTDCGQIKTGSACRTDRIAKYNQLLRIEEKLGPQARFAGRNALRGLNQFKQ